MRITNRLSLPQYLVHAAEQACYPQHEGSIGVSTLIRPPLVRHLMLTRWDDIVEDVDDMRKRMDGDAWHSFCEKSCRSWAGAKTEQFVSTIIDGVKVTGKFDLWYDGVLVDHKCTSAWSLVYDKTAWFQQMNSYAELLERNGYRVDRLEVHAHLGDWNKADAWKYTSYPKHSFVVYPIELWPQDRRLHFLQERVVDHIENPTRPCTPDEQWFKPPTFAVYRVGGQRALRVLDSRQAANEWIKENKPKGAITIEERPGCYRQCEGYCPARSVCDFAKSLIKGENTYDD